MNHHLNAKTKEEGNPRATLGQDRTKSVKLSWIIATMLNKFTTGVNVFFSLQIKREAENWAESNSPRKIKSNH